jgi:hypothetical protein
MPATRAGHRGHKGRGYRAKSLTTDPLVTVSCGVTWQETHPVRGTGDRLFLPVFELEFYEGRFVRRHARSSVSLAE